MCLRMGIGLFLVGSAILFATVAYWTYSPLPPGYSFSSRVLLRVSLIALKMENALCRIGSFLRFGTRIQMQRKIDSLLNRIIPKSDESKVVTHDEVFDGVKVRIYKPSDALNETLPGMTFYHGGGWSFGGVDSMDSFVKYLSKETRTVFVSIDYRLAPEFPFPTPLDDCITATKYFMKNASDYNVDPNRIGVSGDSAGGNLAAAVSLRLRDEKFPLRVKLQVLLYPAVQGLDFDLPSIIQNRNGPFLTRDLFTFATAMYIDGSEDHLDVYSDNRHVPKSFKQTISKTYMNLEKLPKEYLSGYVRPESSDEDETVWNKIKETMLNPYYSPLTADNLENLPDAYVLTGNYDVVRDEGWLYAVKLKEAGNKVTIYNVDNGFHAMANFLGMIKEFDSVFEKVTKFIVDNL